MTTKSYLRGYEIEYLNDQWVYSDTMKEIVSTVVNLVQVRNMTLV